MPGITNLNNSLVTVNKQLNNKIGIIFNVSSCYQNGKDQYFFKVGFIEGSIKSVTIKAENVDFI